MKKVLFQLLFLVVCLTSPSIMLAAGPLDHIKAPTSSFPSSGGGSLDFTHMQDQVKSVSSGTQTLALDVAVFFFEVGCIIYILAKGLKHPEYDKWGRGTIVASIAMFALIKFGPIIFYNL